MLPFSFQTHDLTLACMIVVGIIIAVGAGIAVVAVAALVVFKMRGKKERTSPVQQASAEPQEPPSQAFEPESL